MAAPRHILMTPVGSSGDVHPFLGIGRTLRLRGHDVTVATAGPFREATEQAGLRFVETATAEQFDQLIRTPGIWRLDGIRTIMRAMSQYLQRGYDLCADLHEPGRTTLILHPLAFAARSFCEKHDAPAITCHLAPSIFRTLHDPPVFASGTSLRWLPRPIKRLFWEAVDRVVVDPSICPQLNAWRATLGLTPVRHPLRDWIHTPGRLVGLFPEWFADPQPDWPTNLTLTGFPRFDEAGQHDIDPELAAWIDEHRPIVFTAGSANAQAAGFFHAALDAARELDHAALLLTRFAEQAPDALPEHVRHVHYLPFSEVLPRCAAIVHHGGIGTCAQAMAAGIPQLITPLAFDQPDNAARLRRLNIGDWLRPFWLTGRRAARKLDRLIHAPDVASACGAIAERVRAQDAIAETADAIEAHLT